MLSVHITSDICLWLDNNLPLISILPMKIKIDCNQACEQAIWETLEMTSVNEAILK